MDALHDAIAEYLRHHRRPLVAPAASTSPAPAAMRTPRLAGPRSFSCRFCAGRVAEGEHGDRYHFEELLGAVSCAGCHAERLAQEAAVGGTQGLRQAWYSAAQVTPHCRYCGEVLRDGGGLYPVEKLRAARECGAHYCPF